MTYLLWTIGVALYCVVGVYFAKTFAKSKEARALPHDDLVNAVIAASLFWLPSLLLVLVQNIAAGFRASKRKRKAANDRTYH